MPSTTPTLDHYLSATAIGRLAEQYDISGLEAAWLKGDYGTLYSQESCECVGRATIEQAIESYEESYEGYIVTYVHYRGVDQHDKELEHGLVVGWVTP